MATLTSPMALAVAIMVTGSAHARVPGCTASSRSKGEIELTIKAFFDALRTEDRAAFERVTTRSFDSLDGGARYAGTALLGVVREAHAKGVQLNWSIGPLDTKLRCDVAWSDWENVGSAGIPPAVKPVRWLESAVLVRQDGNWKIDFFHSQRAAQK